MSSGLRRVSAAIVVVVLFATSALASTLSVKTVYQETPEWCWLAVAQMIFEYFDVRRIQPNGPPFQCQLMAIEGGPFSICWRNCGACPVPAGSIDNLANLIKKYPPLAPIAPSDDSPVKALNADLIRRPLTKEEIRDQITRLEPIVALVDPTGKTSLPVHAVLIIGFGITDDGRFEVQIADPFPYQTVVGHGESPYQAAGGSDHGEPRLEHRIIYESLVAKFGWNNTIYNIHPK